MAAAELVVSEVVDDVLCAKTGAATASIRIMLESARSFFVMVFVVLKMFRPLQSDYRQSTTTARGGGMAASLEGIVEVVND